MQRTGSVRFPLVQGFHLTTLEEKAGQAKIEFYSYFNLSRIYWLLFIIIQRLNIILMTFHLICILFPPVS